MELAGAGPSTRGCAPRQLRTLLGLHDMFLKSYKRLKNKQNASAVSVVAAPLFCPVLKSQAGRMRSDFHCGLRPPSRPRMASWRANPSCGVLSLHFHLHLTPAPRAKVPGNQRVTGAGFFSHFFVPEMGLYSPKQTLWSLRGRRERDSSGNGHHLHHHCQVVS